MGNMRTHHASPSQTSQRCEYNNSSSFSVIPSPNFGNVSNPTNPFRLSKSPQEGLGILNSFPDHETKPFSGLYDPSKSNNNIVFAPQIKMNNMIPPPPPPPPQLSVGSSVIYGVGEPSSLPEPTGPDYPIQVSLMTPSFCHCVLGYTHQPCKFSDFLERERQVHRQSHIVANFPYSTSASYDYPFDQFLRICYTCKRKLSAGKDIYIYRGDSSFCSEECRFKEILAETMAENANRSPKSSPTSSKNGVIFFLPFAT